jgi:hypothetical protein
MSTKYGPTPWFHEPFQDLLSDEDCDVEIRDADDCVICTAIPMDGENIDEWGERGRANVALIAAAPELLEALKLVEPYVDELYEAETTRRVIAAIAKAEGRA